MFQGRSPVEVDRLITYRLCHHSAVCLSELTHAFGRLDPSGIAGGRWQQM